ncbi:MAG: response regulator, partial [Prochlorothrix sp.]
MTMKPAEALILVVDDQPQHLETLAAILTAEGYAPVLCPSVDHVWQRATLQQPDLILVDLEFGGGTGLDFCQAVWDHPPDRHRLKTTPIVVLGTIAQRPTLLHALALGAADYVIRPCDPHELCRKVTTQVELHHLRALQQADLLAQQELQQTL